SGGHIRRRGGGLLLPGGGAAALHISPNSPRGDRAAAGAAEKCSGGTPAPRGATARGFRPLPAPASESGPACAGGGVGRRGVQPHRDVHHRPPLRQAAIGHPTPNLVHPQLVLMRLGVPALLALSLHPCSSIPVSPAPPEGAPGERLHAQYTGQPPDREVRPG